MCDSDGRALHSSIRNSQSDFRNRQTFASVRSLARLPLSTGVPRRFLLFVRYSHHSIIGIATASEEYVPMMMPIVRARANPLSTSPPNNTIATTDRNVSPEVITVRESV